MKEFEDCPIGIKHTEEVKSLEERIHKLEDAIIDIRDNLIHRPSWVSTTIIAFFSTLAFSMLTLVLSIIKK